MEHHMTSVLIASVPIHGHVAPLLPIARHFVARGDRVTFLTGARFADAVTATGAEHLALPEGADFDDRTVTTRFPEREGLSPVKAIAFDFEHIFVRPGEHQFAALVEAVRDRDAEVVVCDPLFTGAVLLVDRPRAERVPVVVAGLVPLNFPGPDLAPFGMGIEPRGGLIGRIRNAVLRAASGKVFRPVLTAADEVAQRVNGRPLSGPVLDWLPRADAVAQLTVPAFEYPRPDAPDSLVFTGPIAGSAAHTHPLPDWWSDLDGSRPVVHVTQGTIANDDLTELILPTIRGLADSDVTVVVSTGGVPVETLGTLPANVRAAEFLPYDELFACTDVFVTNGGYGGVQFSLSHGVPLVVAPGKEDKVEVAARVSWSGTGINLRRERPTPAAVRSAVESVLTTASYRTAARGIAADIATASGVAGFAAAVDAQVSAARFAADGVIPPRVREA
jgi:UDP:flavonoid glycosyltransferase YjiC (YdhE family)